MHRREVKGTVKGKVRCRLGEINTENADGVCFYSSVCVKALAQLQVLLDFCDKGLSVSALIGWYVCCPVLLCVNRVVRSQSDGPLLRPSHIENSLPPVTPGVTASSCGKWCRTASGHTGRCPTRTWVLWMDHQNVKMRLKWTTKWQNLFSRSLF